MYRAVSYLSRQGRTRRFISVSGCAVLATPVHEAALQVTVRSWSTVCCPSLHGALVTSKRFQATSSDKKYHCSVCKKPFRLERAAQVHITQSHGGDGAVEAGPGPGFVETAKASTISSGFGAPPTGPTVVTQHKDPHQSADDDDDDYPKGKMRPTPKPLHQPTQDVPEDAMIELLGVWDTIGAKRLGENGFVHSSMVMKVFAGRRVDAKDLPPSYQVDVQQPTGQNPFEAALSKRAAEDTAVVAASVLNDELGGVDIDGPFALAPAVGRGPFCPAAVANPLHSGAVKKLVAAEPIRKVAPTKVDVQAPVTPFGQLPMFGQQTPQKQSEAVAAPLASSPFAMASAAGPSPFAAAASAPMGGNSQPPGVVASPFAAAAASSPFAAAVASPFASGGSASPFAATVDTASPGASAPSPFASSPFAASPFAADTVPSADMQVNYQQLPPDDCFGGQAGDPVREEKKLTCALCGKAFRSEFDLGQHNRQKHNIVVPSEQRKPSGKAKRLLPDLPAYVPSPVDLTTTSPFGSSQLQSNSWAEVPLVLHGHSVSNMTLMGTVLDVDLAVKGAVHLSVAIPAGEGGGEEVVTVRCTGDAKEYATANVKRNLNVLVTGSLRLTPLHETALNKYFLNPVVHVSAPTGSIFLVD